MISIADIREQLLTKCVANPLKGFVCYDNMWEQYANNIFGSTSPLWQGAPVPITRQHVAVGGEHLEME